jgi:hypothetical protein
MEAVRSSEIFLKLLPDYRMSLPEVEVKSKSKDIPITGHGGP